MAIRAIPPQLAAAIQAAAADAGISQAAVVKAATAEWLRARGYLTVVPAAGSAWVYARQPGASTEEGAEQ